MSGTDSLREVLARFPGLEGDGVLVLDPDGHRLLGWVSHRDALRALSGPAGSGTATGGGAGGG